MKKMKEENWPRTDANMPVSLFQMPKVFDFCMERRLDDVYAVDGMRLQTVLRTITTPGTYICVWLCAGLMGGTGCLPPRRENMEALGSLSKTSEVTQQQPQPALSPYQVSLPWI